jgi:hypothetical protein
MTLTAIRATTEDIETVAELWVEAASWLRDRGYDQWQYPVKTYNIELAVANGSCWLIREGDEVSGTVTLDENADESLWWPEDDPTNALYLHRLVVRRKAKARNLGIAIVDWASLRALQATKRWLRLDAWTSNQDLHRYYTAIGFQWVRTVEGPDIPSGALFQRPAGQLVNPRSTISTAEEP